MILVVGHRGTEFPPVAYQYRVSPEKGVSYEELGEDVQPTVCEICGKQLVREEAVTLDDKPTTRVGEAHPECWEDFEPEHQCRNHFKPNDFELHSETVLVKGRCQKCGLELTAVHDLTMLIAEETGATIERFENPD